jgi:hypothetical protein
MKNVITIVGMIAFLVRLLTPQNVLSQGTITTTYISSLSQAPTGSQTVGGNLWAAKLFETGNNPSGYDLDSVQLTMTSSSGSPNGFTVSLYSAGGGITINPGTSLGTLSGSSDPEIGGTYTYTASGLALSPSTAYFIVATAETPVASGAYAWSIVNSVPSATDGWYAGGVIDTSNNGQTWNAGSAYPQFSLTATPTPEPSIIIFGLLGGSAFLFRRRQ